jgi:hypothetical protein
MKKALIMGTFFFIVSNLPPINALFTALFDEGHYRYSNANGSFTAVDILSRKYNLAKIVPDSFLKEHINSTDSIVYRTFWKNPLAFWRWAEYFTDPRYELPYKNWQSIHKIRGYDIQYSNKWQDF